MTPLRAVSIGLLLLASIAASVVSARHPVRATGRPAPAQPSGEYRGTITLTALVVGS